MTKMKITLFMLAAIAACLMMGSVSAMTHIVGGGHGWRLPDNQTFFEEWAKPRTFGVGDRLVFPYRPGSETVVLVKKEDYKECREKDAIDTYYNGPTILDLTKTGHYYFICDIGKHCEAGQKFHITVVKRKGSSGNPFPFQVNNPALAAPITS
ncbi:umecyanin-like isoform X2 [Quercus lobata]|uniref:umecyanin-like isoform X2 n=1 Tax=Quercus lobata TaxID=97700 RepID=UPI001248AE75|nr:umecyanin-like isoform X2 [Quercus lobata]